MSIPRKPLGAEHRLCSLTYSQIAAWSGLSVRSVRQYASNGQFDRRDVASVLAWVNGRRARLGLELIGLPPDPQRPLPVDHEPAESVESAIPLVIPSGGYNPLTGSFQG